MSKNKRNFNQNSRKDLDEKDSKNKNKDDKKDSLIGYIKRFWNYIWHDDSIGSYVANFIFAFIVIKYIFFPSIGFVLSTDYPIVAIVSGSMEHKIVTEDRSGAYSICGKSFLDVQSTISLDFEQYWEFCGDYYENNYNMTPSQFREFDYSNGLNIGDVMVLYGKDTRKIEVGDVLVFKPQDKQCNGESCFYLNYGPVIHRVVEKWEEDGVIYFSTKGDHNALSQPNFEKKIPQDDVIGVGVVRVPFIGYLKIWLTEIFSMVLGVFLR